MTMHSSRNYQRQSNDSDCKDCVEQDNATQKSINRERQRICDLLYGASSEVAKQEEKFTKENELYKQKKCMFLDTEDNYRRFRNLDIGVGTELVQTNESVKTNVATYTKWHKELNTTLKNIAKGLKDVKTKFSDLRKAADDLERCYEDSCNVAQRKALTGKGGDDCKDDSKPPDICKDAEKIIDELICMPKALTHDIDSLFKASADVVGIQIFSNIESLEPLQKTLDEDSKSFKGHIGDVVKLRESDMKKMQEELVKSVQEITKSAMERNNARSNFEGYYDATDFLCCPPCNCLKEINENVLCEPRLKQCQKDICDICEEVKETFCCEGKKEDEQDCAD
jgi:hypothetical protein